MSDEDFNILADSFVDCGKVILERIKRFTEIDCKDAPMGLDVSKGFLLNNLPNQAPLKAEMFEEVMNDVNNMIIPGCTKSHSPYYMGLYPILNSYPAILGEFLAAGLGQMNISWKLCPSGTELEMLVLNWLAKMMNLPEHFHFTPSIC